MALVRKKIPSFKRKPPRLSRQLERLAGLALVTRKPAHIQTAHAAIIDAQYSRIFGCIHKAAQSGDWGFMDGAYSQACEVYVVASMAYEGLDHPIMPDALFDKLALFLLRNFRKIPEATLHDLVLTRAVFAAGTGAKHRVPINLTTTAYYNKLLAEFGTTKGRKDAGHTKARLLRKKPVGRKRPIAGSPVAARKRLARPV